MRKLIFITSLVFTCLITLAQDSVLTSVDLPKNNIGVSLFGEASLISLHYERMIPCQNHHFVNIGVGLGKNAELVFVPGTEEGDGPFTTFPHHVTYNIGNSKHFLELGVGGTGLTNTKAFISSYFVYPIVGYRFRPARKGRPFLRVYANWPFQTDSEETYLTMFPIGIATGLTF